MLADDVAGGQHGWDEVELLLTEGYAQTLALESERVRIERRLAERAASQRRKRSPQTRSLIARHEAINLDIQCLRAVLAELYQQGRQLRDSAVSREEPSSPTSRAA
jgi:hypothetical protein